ncbi:MAG TPA: hypothetical protein VHN16_16270 [Streptosporangiaceae bacterium]|nr:hypothetical protein [Streptosporangiaceae bacterium]
MVWALAVTETISYGVLYSSFAAFLLPMQHSLGFGQTTLTGAFSAGVLVTGARAVPAGAWLDCCGARGLMTAGSLAAGARLAYQIGESLEIKPTGLDEVVSVDLDRIRVTVEPPAEWTQMYHETWRLMRDNFWRADMAGVDWAAMRDRYRPLLDRIGSADDLRDVLWELQGEMGSSHTGVLPPGSGGDPALAQGCSAPISSAPRTGPGGLRGSCPASLR